MRTPLVVYEASAGSGKTFTLAAEYIALLVQNPAAYRQTLAVTFTNKATEEMKTRILSQLYGIWRGLPKSDDYLSFVCKKLGTDAPFVRTQAGLALHSLLHNYSYFRVETIDSFFQSVLRNLAHELDLTTNMRIGLNDVQVEEEAVDEMIDRLTTTDVVLKWVMHYIVDNISDDRSWNVIGQIKHFGRTIFSDFYKRESGQLHEVMADDGFFDRFTATLKKLQASAASVMAGIGDDFFLALEQSGLTADDLSYGMSGVAGFFHKLRSRQFDPSVLGKRVHDCAGQREKWCKKTHAKRDAIYALVDTTLDPLLRRALDEQPRQWLTYQSATLTLRHLNQVRLLGTIEQNVRRQNQDSNLFLLSDTQQLLHEMIDGSDSPFIFEKIGAQLKHIMIDEFQDTSTVQWENFKVLLSEAMSHDDSQSLVVGDVKQSIYRWRSGDWRLLAGIEHEFSPGQVGRIPLSYNYRSARRVVDFNNAFFEQAARLEEAQAYTNICQTVPDNKGNEGYVSITLLPESDYQASVLQTLVSRVSELLQQGVQPAHIAILLRSNSHIALIANHFMERLPGVPIVSDEAFRLDASSHVRLIVQAMRVLADPSDRIAQAVLARAMSSLALHEAQPKSLLPDSFTQQTDDLLRLPLYDLAEQLHTLLGIQQDNAQDAYLCTFYDHLHAFADEQQGDLSAFLREWDSTLCAKPIQSPTANGIRLISIHKSKGLEFPCVIVPFCDWRMEHSDIIWCKPDVQPYAQLPIVPVDYGAKQMQGTIYEPFYNEEHQQTTIDNLNLLYVAFTRAADNLLVIGKLGAKASRSAIIEQVLPMLRLDGAQLQASGGDNQPMTFTYGQLTIRQPHTSTEKQQQPNVFLRTPEVEHIDIRTSEPKAVFLQSNQSRAFAAVDDGQDDDEQQRSRYVQMGSVLHHLFSNIRTTADIDKALGQLECEGIIYDEELTRERIETMIRARLADPRVAQWFSPRWKVFNECNILATDPQSGKPIVRRPDRAMYDGQQMVVVDFKFGRQQDSHHQQVREYMQLLAQMGYTSVQGYLWYVYTNKIVEVKEVESK